MKRFRSRGFTLSEALTALVVIAVLAAVAIPMWRAHLLRVQRADAIAALNAIQREQDRFFARSARYAPSEALTRAPPEGLGLKDTSPEGYFSLELRTDADGLGYVATARARPGAGRSDTRCAWLSLDQNSIRRAQDAEGTDRSADCWR